MTSLGRDERQEAIQPFLGQPCPFCGITLAADEHLVVPCPLSTSPGGLTPYYVQQLAFAHLRLLAAITRGQDPLT